VSLGLGGEPFRKLHYLPNQLRWDPFDHDEAGGDDFVSGLHLVAGAGDPVMKKGLAGYVFADGRGMG
jgi:homogentisate 1,2-dioxygenase